MLERLTVRNLAVVEEAEVAFGPGLNVVTGETGAGKSVLIGALGLVLGGRADSSIVREGAKEAEVEAVFSDASGTVSLRRTVTAEGRSRAWIDDESAAVSELRERGRDLVDIHGPQANHRLSEPGFQRAALDAFGGIDVSGYSAAYGELVAARAARDALLASGGEDEAELLRFQTGELEAAGLSAEDEDIASRHAAAARAGDTLRRASEVTEGLGGDEGAAGIVSSLLPVFAAMSRDIPAASGWAEEAEDVVVRLQELSRSVADATAGLSELAEDLESLDGRLSEINRLERKYLSRPGETRSVARLIEVLAEKKARLDAIENREARLAEAEKALAAAESATRSAGAALMSKRAAAARRLEKAATAELRALGFPKSCFSVKVEPAEPEAEGADRVTYMFAPNPGEAELPLADIASSGELARVMLALTTVSGAAGAKGPGTVVFDEIDANIGGEAGWTVGGRLRDAAASRQVLAVTHLPQTAVHGERHFSVSKVVSGGRTRTGVREIKGEERVSEIARMLGGERLTSVVRKHAKELLELSGRNRR